MGNDNPGELSMTGRKHRWMGLAIAVIFLIVPLSVGCTKKAAIRNETTVHREPEPMIQAPASVVKNDQESRAGELRRQELREQELREQTLGDQTAGGKAPEGAQRKAADRVVANMKGDLRIPDIHFAFDEYKLSTENQAILKAGAQVFLTYTEPTLVIEGHCDERGTVEYNLALGQKRADEAAAYLIDLGIAKERIKTISYGKEMPLARGHDEEAWATNRRDHFVVSQPVRQHSSP